MIDVVRRRKAGKEECHGFAKVQPEIVQEARPGARGVRPCLRLANSAWPRWSGQQPGCGPRQGTHPLQARASSGRGGWRRCGRAGLAVHEPAEVQPRASDHDGKLAPLQVAVAGMRCQATTVGLGVQSARRRLPVPPCARPPWRTHRASHCANKPGRCPGPPSRRGHETCRQKTRRWAPSHPADGAECPAGHAQRSAVTQGRDAVVSPECIAGRGTGATRRMQRGSPRRGFRQTPWSPSRVSTTAGPALSEPTSRVR